jgi:hypothetical protein
VAGVLEVVVAGRVQHLRDLHGQEDSFAPSPRGVWTVRPQAAPGRPRGGRGEASGPA